MARNTDEYRQFTEEYRNFLYDTLSDLPIDELVGLWNKAVDDPKFHHYDYYWIYTMNENEVNDAFGDYTPYDMVFMVYYNEFCPTDDYFWMDDGYDWTSGDIDTLDDFPYDIYDLIDHIMTTGKDYGCEPLLDAINDWTSRHN